MNTILPVESVKQFILAGNAALIVHNTKTGNHRRYRIWKKWEHLYYVYYDEQYLGKIYFGEFCPRYEAMNPQFCYLTEIKGFILVWQWVTSLHLPEHVQLMHSGICGMCNRPLTDPVSISLGIGPECYKKLQELHLNS